MCCNFEVDTILRYVLSGILLVAVAFPVKIVRVCFVGRFTLKKLSRIVQIKCMLTESF
jgi:hypothetical protein